MTFRSRPGAVLAGTVLFWLAVAALIFGALRGVRYLACRDAGRDACGGLLGPELERRD